MFTHTYCNVESNALKFPVFPLDHLLTSASRTSATLCNKIRFCKTKCETWESQNLIEKLHFSPLSPSAQAGHAYSFLQEHVPASETKNEQTI